MATLVGTQTNEKELVKSLISLEHDAMGAYNEVIERLENRAWAQQVEEFRADHTRHVQELEAYARTLGLTDLPDGNAMKSMMAAGKIKIADAMGDKAILMAMKTNETDTVTAYERASTKDFISPELKAICERGFADEKRHRDWMDNTSKAGDEQSRFAA